MAFYDRKKVTEELAILLWKSPDLCTENGTHIEFLENAEWLYDHGVRVEDV